VISLSAPAAVAPINIPIPMASETRIVCDRTALRLCIGICPPLRIYCSAFWQLTLSICQTGLPKRCPFRDGAMAGDRPSKGPEPGFQFRIPGRHRLYIPAAFVEAGSFSLSGQEILAPQQRANAAMRCVKMTRGPRPPVLPGRQIILQPSTAGPTYGAWKPL
jgi:hypothetical protein